MKGKTVVFNGATHGMARFAAIELAQRGAKILVSVMTRCAAPLR